MTKKTLDEHAEAVERRNDVPLDRAYANIFAAYEAERAARIDLERQYLCAKCQHNEARVRELEAERDEALVAAEMWSDNAKAIAASRSRALARAEKAEARAQLERMARRERLLVEEVNGLREEANGLEAQLATLREAAGAYLTAASDGQADTLDPRPDVVRAYDAAERALRAAISTPGPTLAEMRAEWLRSEADRWDAMQYTTPDGLTLCPQPSPSALRQRADELEAGRG